MKKNLLLLACSTLVSLLLLEAMIALATHAGLFRIRVPLYSLDQARSPAFWGDVNPDFGVWHLPNATTRHTASCFDLIYHTNAHGARDVERTLQSARLRIVVLGDSMMEGYGVGTGHRVSDVLERETGIEHLNFGTSGDFGTIQYYLLYQTLASRFTHAAVLIGMIPDNDFWDNDYEFGKWAYPDRYRPYLVGESPHYRLVYHQNSLEQSSIFRGRENLAGLTKRILGEFTYSYNAYAHFRWLVIYYQGRIAKRWATAAGDHTARTWRSLKELLRPDDPSRPYSGFYDYRKDQLHLAEHTFKQIQQLAGSREVIIALLPTTADFKRYDPTTTPPLSAELEQFAAANGMQFVDLLPVMYRHSKDWTNFFLTCDGHWSPHGHAVAAQYLRAALAPLYGSLAQ